MWLYKQWVSGFCENIDQVVIREKEESWENQSLWLQISLKSLLDFFNRRKRFLQVLKQIRNVINMKYMRILLDGVNHSIPSALYEIEFFCLVRQSTQNVLKTENRLQIEVELLNLYPDFEHSLHINHQFFPVFSSLFHKFNVWIISDSLSFDAMVVQ